MFFFYLSKYAVVTLYLFVIINKYVYVNVFPVHVTLTIRNQRSFFSSHGSYSRNTAYDSFDVCVLWAMLPEIC